MARTRVPSEQLQFRSQNTGDHLLDTYLEDAEMGSLTLAQLMGKLFDAATGDIDAFEFRYTNENNAQTLELRIGVDAEFQEVASFTQLFKDLQDFKDNTVSEVTDLRNDAEVAKVAAEAARSASKSAQAISESARDAALVARTDAQYYAGIAYTFTPKVINEGILVAQLHGDLFNGSTL